MIFSRVEKDTKTYHYLREYLDYLNENLSLNTRNILHLDNRIQHEELQKHLLALNIRPDEETVNRHNEIELWIRNNAKQFRQYLSSIKLLACFSYSKGITRGDKISYEEFCSLCDSLNRLKEFLIDHIF